MTLNILFSLSCLNCQYRTVLKFSLKIIFLPMNIFIDAKLSLNMATLNKEIYIYGVHYNMAYILLYQSFCLPRVLHNFFPIPKGWVIWFGSLEFTEYLSFQEAKSDLYSVFWFYLHNPTYPPLELSSEVKRALKIKILNCRIGYLASFNFFPY